MYHVVYGNTMTSYNIVHHITWHLNIEGKSNQKHIEN